jgi:hypothetical protein
MWIPQGEKPQVNCMWLESKRETAIHTFQTAMAWVKSNHLFRSFSAEFQGLCGMHRMKQSSFKASFISSSSLAKKDLMESQNPNLLFLELHLMIRS